MKDFKNIIIIMLTIIIVLLSVIVYKQFKNTNVLNNEENNYGKYAKKLSDEINNFSDSNYLSQRVDHEMLQSVYYVTLNKNKELHIEYSNEELNNVFGNYKISDNVISFYIINDGQAFFNSLYYIKTDGTVGKADVESSNINNKNITITNDLGLKNIITILPTTFDSQESGYHGPTFVDINGNIFTKTKWF